MFTGIIEGVGTILQAQARGGSFRLAIRPPRMAARTRRGASLAVNGVCLTVAGRRNGSLVFDVSAETVRRTTLGRADPGDSVNLERPIKVGDRLGGHLVLGHVDGVGRIARWVREGNSVRMSLEVPRALQPYLVPTGALAVDGVSLTIGGVSARGVTCHLIPETLRRTVLGSRGVGDHVNLEVDIIGKYLTTLLKGRRTSSRARRRRGR